MAKSSAFDIKLSEAKRNDLADELCREVYDAFNARQAVIGDGGLIDYMDWYYEQGRSNPSDRPFPGAADLTSTFITQSVDAMRSRLCKTVFGVEPFCTVDGQGDAAANAPMVEAFHEWQIEEEGLKAELAKCIHGGLLEDCYILEVRERIETRKQVETLDVAIQTTEDGGPILNEDGSPALQMDGDEPVPAQPGQPAANVKRTYTKTRRLGPEFDAISMKDFVFLPNHAKNRRQLWGYAKRFTLRTPELQERAADGVYDAKAVKLIGEQGDREDGTPSPVADIAPQQGPSAEHELIEVSLKRDLDEDGREEWYVVTLSLKHRVLLRCVIDTFVMKVGKSRCVPFVPLPRRNSVYGYIYAEKMLTLAEEDTAVRNMAADRSALATNAPIKRIAGALWDPNTQPFGVGAVIDVRDMNEVQPFEVPDVPPSIVESRRDLETQRERVSGLSDVAVIGTQARQSNTLGQDQMISAASAVRVEELLGPLQTFIADVMELRHAIWEMALDGNEKGLEAPASVVNRLQDQQAFTGRFTPQMLKGQYRFKPYGSVETANPQRQMQYFNEGLKFLASLGQMFPQLPMVMASNPEILKTILQEWARVYKVRNPQVFLNALQMQPPGMMPQAGGMDAAGGQPSQAMPPGMEGLMAMLGGASVQ